ncbi:precorrin-3B C(17)-methyltransferase [Amycolatopsis sp. NPDC024027]|uniref:SecDF P1 head subdomain-containing protein n=1 Tax=Amycolatopsis sp. NPDC024027 TaxID=3154327 RepID=UPI003404FAC7
MLAVVAVLAAVAGCQAEVAGRAYPLQDGFVVKDGTQLRFRPVLSEVPAGPAVGSPGQRQSTDPATQEAAARALSCGPGEPDALDGRDDPALPLVSCDRAQGTRYLLGPGFLSGADVSWVAARVDPETGNAAVTVNFTAAGAGTWAEWTGHNLGKQVAIVLKSRVLTAPMIQSAITGGTTQITGRLTLPEAQQLAREIAGA